MTPDQAYSRFICPHCGAATGFSPVAGPKHVELQLGNYQRVARATGSISDDQSGYFFGVSRCQACGKAFPVRGKATSSEHPDATVVERTLEPLWPTRYRTVPEEIPSPIREAMKDASAALGAGSKIGAMLALRTAAERAYRERKGALDLPQGSLKALLEAGLIARTTFEGSDVARRWARYLAHETDDLAEQEFSREDAEELYTFVEELLDELYVKPTRIARHQARLKGEQKGDSPKTAS